MNKKDYSKVSKSQKNSKSKKEEVLEEKEEIKEITPIIKEGVVNCIKLNVRKEPSKDADILLVINKDEKLKVLDDTDEIFYKVQLSNNVEGYCMKVFIDIK